MGDNTDRKTELAIIGAQIFLTLMRRGMSLSAVVNRLKDSGEIPEKDWEELARKFDRSVDNWNRAEG